MESNNPQQQPPTPKRRVRIEVNNLPPFFQEDNGDIDFVFGECFELVGPAALLSSLANIALEGAASLLAKLYDRPKKQ